VVNIPSFFGGANTPSAVLLLSTPSAKMEMTTLSHVRKPDSGGLRDFNRWCLGI